MLYRVRELAKETKSHFSTSPPSQWHNTIILLSCLCPDTLPLLKQTAWTPLHSPSHLAREKKKAFRWTTIQYKSIWSPSITGLISGEVLAVRMSVLEYYFPFSPFFNREDQSPHHKKENKFSLYFFSHFPILCSSPYMSLLKLIVKAHI